MGGGDEEELAALLEAQAPLQLGGGDGVVARDDMGFPLRDNLGDGLARGLDLPQHAEHTPGEALDEAVGGVEVGADVEHGEAVALGEEAVGAAFHQGRRGLVEPGAYLGGEAHGSRGLFGAGKGKGRTADGSAVDGRLRRHLLSADEQHLFALALRLHDMHVGDAAQLAAGEVYVYHRAGLDDKSAAMCQQQLEVAKDIGSAVLEARHLAACGVAARGVYKQRQVIGALG